jgi:hypothetical protein
MYSVLFLFFHSLPENGQKRTVKLAILKKTLTALQPHSPLSSPLKTKVWSGCGQK